MLRRHRTERDRQRQGAGPSRPAAWSRYGWNGDAVADAGLAIVEAMRDVRMSDYVFPGTRGALSKQALGNALRRVRRDVTAHGFRATFRSWAADQRAPHEIAEMALGHAICSAVLVPISARTCSSSAAG